MLEEDDPPDGAPLVLVLDEVTPAALEHLSAAVGDRHRRALVVVTGRAGMGRGDGWRLLEHGADDVVVWGPELPGQLADRLHRWAALAELMASDTVREELVGSSVRWLAALTRLVEAARFSGSPLLITGESGTGKELAARLVHHLDPRVVRGRLVVLDCTTVVPGLSGSEFFGHEKGAFTGAHAARDGAFAAAHGGTLFLDEVGELPPPLQAELLRVVQEGTYKRVGGNDWRHASFRLVCATNRDLLAEVEGGRFRADLYHRIAVSTVTLPPLRDRPDDVLPLFEHFLRVVNGSVLGVDSEVADLLRGRSYPGNVRDLRQLALRVLTRHVGSGPITVGDVPEEERPRMRPVPIPRSPADSGDDDENADEDDPVPPPPSPPVPACGWAEPDLDAVIGSALDRGVRYDDIHAAVRASARRVALHRAGGNQKRAAEMLGLTPRALQKQRQRAATADGAP
ncbi:MAG TPA: sigma 54-interacting transcriptional regulator [Geodermatophilus sp.]|nr:sigma 54-interacting transcriptional regulator [Geodermatophilus sp.]